MKDHNPATASTETLKEDYGTWTNVLNRGIRENDSDLKLAARFELDDIEKELKKRNEWH